MNVEKNETNRKRSKAIADFFKTHPDIKRLPICQEIGYDSSNLSKAINKDNWHITAAYLTAFERKLIKYGFEPYKVPDLKKKN